jgi:Xaa-Pro aminopeptidase
MRFAPIAVFTAVTSAIAERGPEIIATFGKFGIRLEDCWHMTEAGPKFFTQPPPSIDKPFG